MCCRTLPVAQYYSNPNPDPNPKVANPKVADFHLHPHVVRQTSRHANDRAFLAARSPANVAPAHTFDLMADGTQCNANVSFAIYLLCVQAVKKQKAFLSKGGEEVDDRKRKYNSMTSSDVRERRKKNTHARVIYLWIFFCVLSCRARTCFRLE